MDVKLPDGTVIQNVPDDMTKVQLAQKLQANGYDVSKLRPEPTTGERAAALGAGVQRGGVAGLLGLPVDTAENLINLGIGGVNRLLGRGAESTPPLQGSFGGSQYIADKLRGVGATVDNPRPDDPASRMLYTGGVLAGGSAGMPPAQALASAASGAIAGETLGPQWIGPASMLPAAASQGVNAVRQATADRTKANVNEFRTTGAEPSVGQATDSAFAHGIENLLSKYPGGAEIMQKFARNQQEKFGSPNQTGVTAEKAGRAIQQGITGEGGFLDRTKAQWAKLDNAVAEKIPQGSSFSPTNTMQALEQLTTPVAGAEKTTGALVNPKLAEMKSNLATDLQANNGVVPFDALRALRSKVGSMLDDALVTGIPGGELKKVYGGLSKDLESAANAVGAGKEFSRQSNYYSARMDRIESVLDKVLGNAKTPESVFNAVMPTNADQSSTLTATLRSISPDERRVVTDAVVNRLGRATPGKQNELGDVFSTETFLTNWNKLSDRAKNQFFPDEALRVRLNKLSAVAGNIREGAKGFTNPSGTAGSFAAYSIYTAPFAAITAALTGYGTAGLETLGIAGGSLAAANITAKMMTNPKIVDWLANAPRTRPDQSANQLAKLGVIYNQIYDPQLKQDLGNFVNSISGK